MITYFIYFSLPLSDSLCLLTTYLTYLNSLLTSPPLASLSPLPSIAVELKKKNRFPPHSEKSQSRKMKILPHKKHSLNNKKTTKGYPST
ncbi:hypothetical protein BCY86_02415 [Pajaroellobacter abortibovis]|uniref:Uncharacterized protein n=1 Tax=Pajaroellobacter abortibovis TaxID=1882918 RepID=A0A1L6MVZ7_9BACT|nr:hypothetical protein BCY86_02415 [Pajaroellobacter abortibovis]